MPIKRPADAHAQHLDPAAAELFSALAKAMAAPLSADCAAIVLEVSPELWAAYVWTRDAEPRVLTIPAAPPSAWLSRVLGGSRFAIVDASRQDEAAHGGFPWLDDAHAWLAVPIEDAGGTRLGAIVAASHDRRTPWQPSDDSRLTEIVEHAAVGIERVWLRLELAKARRERSTAFEEAEEFRRRRDTMIAVLGHELRNPLAPLVTALELLWETAPECVHPELSVIDRQSKQLGKVVNELLDFSRLFRGELELELRRIRVRDVLLSAAEHVQTLLAARDHALVADVSAEVEVEADEARLTQTVAALISNAAKHTPPGRTIELSARSVGDQIEIIVADDGGVDAHVLAAAFEPFQSADVAEYSGGMGLGLPIARALVVQHGGELELRSAGRAHGTEAVVRLPRKQPEARGVGAFDKQSWSASLPLPRRVLIVDDNRDAADMLADVIRRWSGTAVVAYDGETALARASETRFDVALVDIGLPRMNGLELARRLRALRGHGDLQIIAVTGFGEPADRERSLDAGMDAHMVKPISMPELRKILTQARVQ